MSASTKRTLPIPEAGTPADPVLAARLYATDRSFAAKFDAALEAVANDLETQAGRVRQLLGSGRRAHPGAGAPKTKPEPRRHLTPEMVLEVVCSSGRSGASRGDIAVTLGMNPRDQRLTRFLKLLRRGKHIKQNGTRRAARYYA